MTPGGKVTEVDCVVKTTSNKGSTHLCEVALPNSTDTLLITPYHPVRIEGTWQFPCDIAPAQKRACEAVYSFVLREKHMMIVGGVECVTLGHGFDESEVVQHPFFGTMKVVEALKQCRGWKNGLVVFAEGCLIRGDDPTKLVCGLTNEISEESTRKM